MGLSNYLPNSRMNQPGVCTSATRPVSPYEGQVIYETDTDSVYVWNGSSWANIVSDSPRNLLYNGEMLVAQRNTTISGRTSTNYFTADRWKTEMNLAGTYTLSVVDDVPETSGFSKALNYLCTSATISPDYLQSSQLLEGFDCQSINMGTAAAKSLWLSFWVKSNVTGIYNAEIRLDNFTVHLSKQYTINVANTWQKVVLEYKPNTSNSITANTNAGLTVRFWLAAGSAYSGGTVNPNWGGTLNQRAVGNVNLSSAVNNYWRITGTMLSVGYPAPFEFKSYNEHLRDCFRYCQIYGSLPVNVGADDDYAVNHASFSFPLMRTAPTTSTTSITFEGHGVFTPTFSIGNGSIRLDTSGSGYRSIGSRGIINGLSLFSEL
jgi:hypothetical protein